MSHESQIVKLYNYPRNTTARAVWRRNYRWMRRTGMNPVTARIILDSTAGVVDYDRVDAVLSRVMPTESTS